MKTASIIFFSILLTFSASNASDEVLTKKVGEIITTEVSLIKKGSKRSDLKKHFTTEGGISTPTKRTYVSKRCPYIKIDVQFQPVHADKESESDMIQKISKPYLALSVVD